MVAFFFGILWRRASAPAAVLAMVLGPIFGLLSEFVYDNYLGTDPAIAALFGEKLNFMHRVFLTFVLSSATLIGLSLTLYPNKNEQGFERLKVDVNAGQVARAVGLFLTIQAVFVGLVFLGGLSPKSIALWAGLATLGLFVLPVKNADSTNRQALIWAGILTAVSVGVLYYFA